MIQEMKLLAVFILFLSGCSTFKATPEESTAGLFPLLAVSEASPASTPDRGEGQSAGSAAVCPAPSKTVDIAPEYYGRAAGESPVWAIINRFELVFASDEFEQNPLREYGYQFKVLWVLEKNSPGKVQLSGGNLVDGKPLWFQLGGDEPAMTPTLDPLNPGAYSNPDYLDYPSYLFLPGPGCYFIEADWGEGIWRINLTVE
jgi:hypothetical protein